MAETPETPMTRTLSIYVRKRKIRRSGQVVDGFQAGFNAGPGGVTCVDKQEAIEHMRQVAHSHGWRVIKVIDSTAANQ